MCSSVYSTAVAMPQASQAQRTEGEEQLQEGAEEPARECPVARGILPNY